MPTPDRRAETRFDDWLDTFVGGVTTTPMPDGAAEQHLTERQEAARQFHRLAVTAGSASGMTGELDAIWEGVMNETTSVPSQRRSATTAVPPAGRGVRILPPSTLSELPRWRIAVNSLLAAGLILAVMAGYWSVTGGFNLGSENDGTSIPFAAVTATEEGGTPSPVASGKGEPILSDSPPIDMPGPSDCTVEPLSVDDVLAIVEDPTYADGSRTPVYVKEDRASPPPGGWPGTEGPGYTYIGEAPSQEMLDEIAVAHRERVACAMTGSWFHIWALSDPAVVYHDVTERLYPTYITKDGARALLEELTADGQAGDLPPLAELWGDFEYVGLVDPNPASSHQVFEDQVEVGTLGYTAAGRQIADGGVPVVAAAPHEEREERDAFPLTYVWSENAGRWLVYQFWGQSS